MPHKSIAVPLNPSARRGGRLLAASDPRAEHEADSEEPAAAPVSRSPRQAAPRPPLHRYRSGERLRMGNGGNIVSRAASYCTIVSLLPYEGRGALLYRVRSDAEAFERVVAEADLSRE